MDCIHHGLSVTWCLHGVVLSATAYSAMLYEKKPKDNMVKKKNNIINIVLIITTINHEIKFKKIANRALLRVLKYKHTLVIDLYSYNKADI